LGLEALRGNIGYVIEEGIVKGKGFIICPCGTGEYAALSKDEHKKMVETAADVAGDKLPVVAEAASCYYKEAIELAKNAEEAGAKCVMILIILLLNKPKDDNQMVSDNSHHGIQPMVKL